MTHSAAALRSEYAALADGEEVEPDVPVAVAGRVMTKRVFGKLAFITMQDESGTVQASICFVRRFVAARVPRTDACFQRSHHRRGSGPGGGVSDELFALPSPRAPPQLYLDKKKMGAERFKQLLAWTDPGDLVGVTGGVKRTMKGELSVNAASWAMLTKALAPLPDKFKGFTDVNKRYRQRHLDMIVNPAVRDTFRARARITAAIRSVLNERGFLEIETPTLHSQPGGAEVRGGGARLAGGVHADFARDRQRASAASLAPLPSATTNRNEMTISLVYCASQGRSFPTAVTKRCESLPPFE